MKILSGVLGFSILVLVLDFALSNQQEISLALWPFSGSVFVPLYAVGLVPLAFGFVVGGLCGWLGGVPHRLRARRLNKELAVLSDKIGMLQKNAAEHPAPIKGKSSFWRFK